jgi:DNA-binding HxlR family transcriptional regulator
MAVASVELLSAGKGAELIRNRTGRSCSRQNLEKLCKQGKLPRSTVSDAPVRVRASLLVEEYLSCVDPRQSVRERPGIAQAVLDREPAPARAHVVEVLAAEDAPQLEQLPDYTESKKKTEYEKGLILELERKQKEGTLLDREEVERAWANVAGKVKSRVLQVASAAKQRIPHLDPEEVEILQDMLREALFELAAEGESDG